MASLAFIVRVLAFGVVVVGAEVVVGYLFAWVVRKARLVGERTDGQVDAALEAGVDRLGERLRGLVAGKPGAPAALERLDAEARQGLEAPSAVTERWLAAVLQDAAERDADFAAAVDALVGQLQAPEASVGGAQAPGGVAVSGVQQTNADRGGLAAGVIVGGAHVANPPVPGPPQL